MDCLRLYVSVPIAGFRVAQAREYWETYPCPPPSTVYGMLLSAAGESDRLVHQGAEIALALLTNPPVSVVLRTLWRVKEKNYWRDPTGCDHIVPTGKERKVFEAWVKKQGWSKPEYEVGPGLGSNKRPDFQELLSDVRLSVWVRMGQDGGALTLMSRLLVALGDPSSVKRFGGLSLGESTMLVDEVRRWRDGDPAEGSLLLHDDDGDLSLPVWPDHVGSKGTRWGQYKLGDRARLPDELPDSAWTLICPPDAKDN